MNLETQLLKLIIFLAFGILFSLYLSNLSIHAQGSSNSTYLSDIINNKYKNQAQVLSESPTTLILTVFPESGPVAAEVIDLVKQSGYTIDAATAFVPPRGASQTDFPELYTLFFSKQ